MEKCFKWFLQSHSEWIRLLRLSLREPKKVYECLQCQPYGCACLRKIKFIFVLHRARNTLRTDWFFVVFVFCSFCCCPSFCIAFLCGSCEVWTETHSNTVKKVFNLKCFAKCQLQLRLFASECGGPRCCMWALADSDAQSRSAIINSLETFNVKCLVSRFLSPRCTLHLSGGWWVLLTYNLLQTAK